MDFKISSSSFLRILWIHFRNNFRFLRFVSCGFLFEITSVFSIHFRRIHLRNNFCFFDLFPIRIPSQMMVISFRNLFLYTDPKSLYQVCDVIQYKKIDSIITFGTLFLLHRFLLLLMASVPGLSCRKHDFHHSYIDQAFSLSQWNHPAFLFYFILFM